MDGSDHAALEEDSSFVRSLCSQYIFKVLSPRVQLDSLNVGQDFLGFLNSLLSDFVFLLVKHVVVLFSEVLVDLMLNSNQDKGWNETKFENGEQVDEGVDNQEWSNKGVLCSPSDAVPFICLVYQLVDCWCIVLLVG